MELRLLGPVELHSAGARVDLGAPKQRCVLAVLALSAGTAVSPESLIDHVWGERQPRDVRGVLYSHIARLRRLLGAAAGEEPRALLRKESAGYVLDLDRDRVDVHRFRATVDAARHAGDDGTRSELLREALALWRGVPLSGIPGHWADSVRASLEQARLDALADRVGLDLDAGRAGPELIDELTGLLAEHPLEERFAGPLMLALHRGGRTAEALTAYQNLRHRLADDLGNDPDLDLQQLHQRILRNDPALRGQPAAPPRRPDTPRQLPIAPATFIGRQTELDGAIHALTADDSHAPPVVAVYGPGGVGKSALALRAAADVSGHYPDGQLYIDLQGSSPGLKPLSPDEALGRFLRSLGVPGPAVPAEPGEAAAKLRSLLADRRVLLMLDNAADTAQARPLLPAGTGCAVLITSRAMLTGLDNARHIGLGVLRPTESAALLARLDATARTAADPAIAGRLAELCGHLPLALRITAARMTSRPDWPLTTFAERLTDQRHRLDHLGHKDVSVRSCFEVSYQALLHGDPDDQGAARAFRLLGLPDGPDISLPIAARLLDMAAPRAEAVLDQLTDAQLIDNPTPGRYRMHDLLRLYARERAQREVSETDRHAALGRVWRCYVSTTAHAGQLLRPGRRIDLVKIDPDDTLPLAHHDDAQAWLEIESANLLAAGHQAAIGDLQATTVQLAHALFGFMHINAHWRQLRDLNAVALDVARARGDRSAEAQVLSDLGVLAWRTGDGDEALRLFRESLAVRREVGDPTGEVFSLYNLGIAHGERGQHKQARHSLEKALSSSRAIGYRSGEALALDALARVCRQLGHVDTAIDYHHQSLRIYRELGDPVGEGFGLRRLGETLSDRRQFAEAIVCFNQALDLYRQTASSTEEVWTLVQLGETHRLSGDARRAMDVCEQALALSHQVGTQQEHGLALWRLGNAMADLGKTARARECWSEALPIFERLGAPEADDVRRLLSPVSANDR